MMSQSEIRNATDVVRYLREYAIRSMGNQPLAIGVNHDAYEKIVAETGAEKKGMLFMNICNVRIVAI